MDMRLSISNWLTPISFGQFKSMVVEFKEVVERSFKSECSHEIRAMNRCKWSGSRRHDDDTIAFLQKANDQATFFSTSDLANVTQAVFASAAYIEVSYIPLDKTLAPGYFGHLEFKGRRRRQATFYLQPGDSAAINSLKNGHRLQLFGNGNPSNSLIG